MYTEAVKRKGLIPALIGAGVCLLFSRSSLLILFFLIPLGFLAFRYGYRVAWNAVLFAVAGNMLLAMGTALTRGFAPTGFLWGVFAFTFMVSVFTWVTAPPPGFSLKFCATARLVIGSSLASLLFIDFFFRAMASPYFLEHVGTVTQAMAARQAAAGSDVVRNALFAEMTPEMLIHVIRSTVLRGGALVFSALMFFICRQTAFLLARLFARDKPLGANSHEVNSLALFRAHPALIWVLSVSLLLAVLASMANLEIPGILLWNILIVCGILYLAQGIGILQFFLAGTAITPFLKLLLCITFIVLFLSPGINAVLFGGVVLLGIAENWVPFRVPKSNGPSSTPEAGDSGN